MASHQIICKVNNNSNDKKNIEKYMQTFHKSSKLISVLSDFINVIPWQRINPNGTLISTL